jgi:hypothetical protein
MKTTSNFKSKVIFVCAGIFVFGFLLGLVFVSWHGEYIDFINVAILFASAGFMVWAIMKLTQDCLNGEDVKVHRMEFEENEIQEKAKHLAIKGIESLKN